MNRKSFIIITLLFLLIAGGIYIFMFRINIAVNPDQRTAIPLNSVERESVLKEMRAFLISVQQITKGISENDMKLVSAAARRVGRSAQADVPVTLMSKLPTQFKQLGFDTHTQFDQLALDIEDMGDHNHALTQLSELMQNCISCHAAYRIELSAR